MQFYKTVDRDDLIRIEDEEGSAVTVLTRGSYALLLSLVVPESDRREGRGTALLEVVAGILSARGIKKLEADYLDDIGGLSGFLRETGFSEGSFSPVLSVDLRTLLSKAVVKRAILSEVDGVEFVSLNDLDPDQWEEFFKSLTRKRLMIGNADIARFFYDASGLVYDARGRLEAFILCSLDEDEASVHVDFMVGMGKGKPQYIMGAVRGMMLGLLEAGGARVFQNITMVAADPAVSEILERVLKDKEAAKKIGNAVFAVKELGEIPGGTEVEDVPAEGMDEEWRREIRQIPFQANIGLKVPWVRHRGDTARGKGYEEAPGETGRAAEERAPVSELLFRKDVEETEGLEYDDTIRITPDNLERYRDYLDDVSISDMARFFYRGLIALTDGSPCGVLVYELKDFEELDATEAEITYLSIRDEEAGKHLLAEFLNEAEKDSVKRICFELAELSDLEREVLQSFGFLIENREGRDLSLTLGDLRSIPILSKRSRNYIKSIRSLSEKQIRLGINSCLFRDKKGILEDLGILPTGWFERDVSSCVVSDGKVTGLFLTHVRGDKRLSIDLLYAVGEEYQADLLYMLRYSLAAALKKYPAETEVLVRRHDRATRILTERLFPDISGRTVFAGERSGE